MQTSSIKQVQASHNTHNRQLEVSHIRQGTTRLWTELGRQTGSASLTRCSSYSNTMQFHMIMYSLFTI
jgi:hypothetical protein